MTAAMILHADGTLCRHEPGPDRFARADGDGWWCPAGEQVTHLQYGGTAMPVGDAIAGAAALAGAFAAALTPVLRAVMAALARFEDLLGADPRLQVLAAACRRYDTEAGEACRASRGDPCGDGQISGQLTLPGT